VKLLPKLALTLLLILVLVMIAGGWWLLFYRGDLTDVGFLAQFTPDTLGVVSDVCFSRPITVIPAREIAGEIKAAVKAAEPETTIPFQVAQTLVCGPKRYSNLRYALDEYRLMWRIRLRFTREQILTIYMNRAYFAHDTFGVGDASSHFFGKKPKDLTIAEAALLAGMIRAPGRFSPYKYPDAALQRRDEVIEAMRIQGAISDAEASQAKAKPLGVFLQSAQQPTRINTY
jgi:penicillin-binding protein 1A